MQLGLEKVPAVGALYCSDVEVVEAVVPRLLHKE